MSASRLGRLKPSSATASRPSGPSPTTASLDPAAGIPTSNRPVATHAAGSMSAAASSGRSGGSGWTRRAGTTSSSASAPGWVKPVSA